MCFFQQKLLSQKVTSLVRFDLLFIFCYSCSKQAEFFSTFTSCTGVLIRVGTGCLLLSSRILSVASLSFGEHFLKYSKAIFSFLWKCNSPGDKNISKKVRLGKSKSVLIISHVVTGLFVIRICSSFKKLKGIFHVIFVVINKSFLIFRFTYLFLFLLKHFLFF